jgi:hypothetical protein
LVPDRTGPSDRHRRIGAQGGTWVAKLRIAHVGRWIRALGPADDVLDAGDDIRIPPVGAAAQQLVWKGVL